MCYTCNICAIHACNICVIHTLLGHKLILVVSLVSIILHVCHRLSKSKTRPWQRQAWNSRIHYNIITYNSQNNITYNCRMISCLECCCVIKSLTKLVAAGEQLLFKNTTLALIIHCVINKVIWLEFSHVSLAIFQLLLFDEFFNKMKRCWWVSYDKVPNTVLASCSCDNMIMCLWISCDMMTR